MKGQVALEFMTTYGWAVLVLLVMIGTMSYFGIVSPAGSCLNGVMSVRGLSVRTS